MAGYNGYSMSNNAISAYADGEKPSSKWTKKEILSVIENIKDDLDFSKLTLTELKDNFLYQSSWHHTSKLYNITYFYSVDISKVEECTQDEINNITSNRPKKIKREKAEIEAEKQVIEKKQQEKTEKKELEKLFKYQAKYKTLKGFLKSNIDVEFLREKRLNLIKEKREALLEEWSVQLDPNHRIWSRIHDDNFIEKYIH